MDDAEVVINGRLFRDPVAVELAPFVTPESADFVKQLRLAENSYGAVGVECAEAWGMSFPTAPHGYLLCVLAAAVLGEDTGADPW